ncbi:MAG: 30S ribosomal protein S9 [Chitinophagales bacterium]|jgi:small subunit ribosomal protein S9|nr:30S ribosomal protein S9 [Chitinophagales bacterium]
MAKTNTIFVGRRKASVARVYLTKGTGVIKINRKDLSDYFPIKIIQDNLMLPLKAIEQIDTYDIHVNVNGGGFRGQAEAVRLGIARALVGEDETFKPSLKKQKLLTRDARVVERKKTGLRKARRKEQFSKR